MNLPRTSVSVVWIALSLLLSLPLAVFPSWATSFVEQPFQETVEQAPTILRGRIGNHYSDWAQGSGGSRRIYTFYELQLDEVIKGSAEGPTVLIRELGGEKDGIGMQIAGAAHFERGEDVVVMLSEKNPDGSYDIRGLMTGKFNIKHDQSGKEVLQGAIPDEHMMAEMGSQADTPPDGKWTLEALRKLVASQAGSSSAPVTAKESPRPSVHPSPSSSPAPQLQPSTPQGAPESPISQPETQGESHWIYWAIGVLLLGGLGIWAMTRKRKF